jgi:hypothetical protein
MSIDGGVDPVCRNPGGFGCFEEMLLRCQPTGGENGAWAVDPTSWGCASLCDGMAIADGCPCAEEGRVECFLTGGSAGVECVDGTWAQFTDPARCLEAGLARTDTAVE